jgi:hypothetical protein
MNDLQKIAAEFASHGLVCVPALDKIPAIKPEVWEFDPPSEIERNAMFADPDLNIAVICGAASGNLMQIDAETPRALDREYERCHRAGITNTWLDICGISCHSR